MSKITTYSEVRAAATAFKRKHGQPALRALLRHVAGVNAISEIPANKIAEVLAACERGDGAYTAAHRSLASKLSRIRAKAFAVKKA